MSNPSKRAQRIAELNDKFRTALGVYPGKVVQTHGISSLSQADQSAIREKVETYTDFNEGNNPYGERDFGKIVHNGETIFWKIDYYDLAYEYGSEKPEDATVTRRVLTILLAAEY